MSKVFFHLNNINNFMWGNVGFFLIVFLGVYFTHKSRYFQIKRFPYIIKLFFSSFKSEDKKPGISPIRLLITSIGGSIGIGNIVGICTAIQIGGPGAIFWTWIAGFLGMIIQYTEVFLGMKYRKRHANKSYSGGPMHFLPKAFKNNWVGIFIAIIIGLYGVEIFLFNVMKDSVAINWHINKTLLTTLLLFLIFISTIGGIKKVSSIISYILPVFLGLYIFMILFILAANFQLIPGVFLLIFKSAFTKTASIGGFAGSTLMLTISMGLSRGAYAADLGVGYNSVIHSESNTDDIKKQATLATFGVFFNTFILCSLATFAVIITNKWSSGNDATLMLQEALSTYFPFMHIFMPFFLFLLGYITIITLLVIGLKCAEFISKKRGKVIYYLYSFITLFSCSFINATEAFALMSFMGAILLIINLIGIFLLRKEIEFDIQK